MTVLVGGVVAALGLSPAEARAVRVRFGRALWSRDEEHAYPLPAGDGATIDKENQIILVRFAQKVYAFNLSCPHQNTALHWLAEEGRFQCPKHKSRYQPDGVFISGRATRNMDRFAVRRDGDTVVVDVDKMYRSDRNAAEWESAVVTL
ncbi:MAG TPA: Rieske (2Fe-2S) protein [Gemmatimonadales bacterium]|nr:Rieske (2Fe-2S) protein [Gemmatimonadales bacterium]